MDKSTISQLSREPLVSICIANYNGAEVIEDCLNSVFAQDCNFSLEVIVHDDASTDGSAEIVRERYPSAILIPSKENVGFCVSNNRMAARARGKYILLLNNDAALFPDALSTLERETERIGKPAILGLPQYDAVTGDLLDIGSLLDPFLNSVPNLDPSRNEVGMVAGACLWTHSALWQELGGFPEWFGSIAEDLHLCCRARLAGYSVRALGISGYRHRVGASFGGGKTIEDKLITTFRRRHLSERNKSFSLAICYPFPAIFIVFPLHLFLLAFEGLVLSLIKKDNRFWTNIYGPCLAALWQWRAKLLRERMAVQASRKPGGAFFSVFVFVPYKFKMLLRHGLPTVT
ncbi:MAG: glycosyltransferase family 2 protein [Sulfuricella sp.]